MIHYMQIFMFVIGAMFGAATTPDSQAATVEPERADLVIYGATSAGVTAAVQARRMGKTVILLEPGRHVGGMTSSGLGATDIGNKRALGGIAREFYRRIGDHYARPESWTRQTRESYQEKRRSDAAEGEMWTIEPHVAEQVFRDLLKQSNVNVIFNARLDRTSGQGVRTEGGRIVSLRTLDGREYLGAMYLDCTYEGDLMAAAGVPYQVGREGNAVYGETLNGVQLGSTKHQFLRPVDPYVVPGDPASGLLPGVHAGPPGEHGQGDKRVQAYNFRLCMTDDPDNKVAWSKPERYDPSRYELLLRYLLAGQFDVINLSTPMPNRKTDTNNHGAFSSDNIGMNYDYPEGDDATRARIIQDHRDYQMGMMWFLANDPRVPESVRKRVARWGLSKDEFVHNDHWPHQLYVREARRMIGQTVMTEHHCRGTLKATDSVGMGAYNMDSHNVQRYVAVNRTVFNEGDVQVPVKPYPISFGAIVPKAEDGVNLGVPVALSASHIAYGSIRMEPVFMVLGQSAATAACLAIDGSNAIQKVPYADLRARLLADGQVLEWD